MTSSPSALRLMLSRYRGRCETCRKPINRGSAIGWSKRRGAHHAACVGLEVPAEFAGAGQVSRLAAELSRQASYPPLAVVPDVLDVPEVPADLAEDDGLWERLMVVAS